MRKRLLRLLAVNGSNLRTASLALGRNAAYLHQFINRGTPKVVAEDDRDILAEHLDCRPEILKHDRSVRHKVRPKRSPLSGLYSAQRATALCRRPMSGGRRVRELGTDVWRRPRRRGCSPTRSSATSSVPSPAACG